MACMQLWLGIVFVVQLADINAPHLGPAVLCHMVHCMWRIKCWPSIRRIVAAILNALMSCMQYHVVQQQRTSVPVLDFRPHRNSALNAHKQASHLLAQAPSEQD